jgi:hypothetical protein
MPKNKVSDPITDQEIAFARLILSGTMTDRRAAEAVGLNPGTAAYTKAKPRVRDYILEHRAAVQQKLAQQEAHLSRRDVDGLHRRTLDREQVLDRLWQLANLGPEMTRGSITGQVKALSIIVAVQNFIPDPRAGASEKKSVPAAAPQIYKSAWLREKQATTHATTNDPQPGCAPGQEGDQPEDSPAVPASPGMPWKAGDAPASPAEAPPEPGPSQSSVSNPSISEAPPMAPPGPAFNFVPDLRVPFSIKKNPFARPR